MTTRNSQIPTVVISPENRVSTADDPHPQVCSPQLSDAISRRRFQELVAEERQNRRDNMKRIHWLVPGAAWSIDTPEYGPEKIKITPLRDLASKY